MYHRFLRAKIHSVFNAINAGDYMPMINGLADTFEYRFHGDHALGGYRTTREAMVRWWKRVFRLLPGVQFSIHEIILNGGPLHTRAAIRATVFGTLPDATKYENVIFQFMTIRRGKVTSIETLEDAHTLNMALRKVAQAGYPQALAEPIR